MTRFADNYRRVARTLGRIELSEHSIEDCEPPDNVLEADQSQRFLGYYGDVGILHALERYGLLDSLRRRGYDHFQLELSADDVRHALALSAVHISGSGTSRLVELAVRRDHLYASQVIPNADESDLHVLTVDWLALKDPNREFRLRRLRLPGQESPGLGIGERVLEILHQMARRLELSGVLTVAEHFHNALIYAREMPFLDPKDAGNLDALTFCLFERYGLTLPQATWAVDWGQVIDKRTGRPFSWCGEPQLKSWHPVLANWLISDEYREKRHATAQSSSFMIDEIKFERLWARRLESLLDPPSGDI